MVGFPAIGARHGARHPGCTLRSQWSGRGSRGSSGCLERRLASGSGAALVGLLARRSTSQLGAALSILVEVAISWWPGSKLNISVGFCARRPGPKIPVEALRSPCQLGRRSVAPPARRSESRHAAVFPLPALHRLRGCITESRGGSGLARVPGDGAVSPRPTLLSHPPISAPASRRHPLAARRLRLQVGDVRWCHPLCSGCALVLSRLSGGVEGWRRLAAAVFPAPTSSSCSGFAAASSTAGRRGWRCPAMAGPHTPKL